MDHNLVVWIESLVGIVALASLAWICVPDLLQSLGLGAFRNGVRGVPSDISPKEHEERYSEQYRQLLELGFQPLGIYWERFVGVYEEDYALALPAEGCMACVNQLLGAPNVVFVTVFAEGPVVRTSNYAFDEISEPDWLVQSRPTNCLADVLNLHREGVTRFRRRGLLPLDCATLEAFAEAQTAYFRNPAVQRFFRRSMRLVCLSKAGLLAIVPALAAVACLAYGVGMLLPSLLLLACCGAWLIYEKKAEKNIGKDLMAQQETKDLLQDPSTPSIPQEALAQINQQLRQKVERRVNGLLGRLVAFLAQRLTAAALPRPLAFDLARGWLEPGVKFDLVETIGCPCPLPKSSTGLLRWAWHEPSACRMRLRQWLVVLIAQFIVFGVLGSAIIVSGATLVQALILAYRGVFSWQRLVMSMSMHSNLLLIPLLILAYTVWSVARMLAVASALSPTNWGRLTQDDEGNPLLEYLYPAVSTPTQTLKCRARLKSISDDRWVLDGPAHFQHPTGEPAGELAFAEGLPHGPVQAWHPNGRLKLEGNWKNGYKTGTWKRWSQSGKLLGTENYENGVLVVAEGCFDADPDWGHLHRYYWACPAFAVQGPVQIQRTETQQSS